MLLSKSAKPLCASCSRGWYFLFSIGFSAKGSFRGSGLSQTQGIIRKQLRAFHAPRSLSSKPGPQGDNIDEAVEDTTNAAGKAIDQEVAEDFQDEVAEEDLSNDQLEAAVREARNTFGASLPPGYLSPAEHKIYERLYGPPLNETLPGDDELLEEFNGTESTEEQSKIYRQGEDGALEEVKVGRSSESVIDNNSLDEDLDLGSQLDGESEEEYATKMALTGETITATQSRDSKENEDPVPTEHLEGESEEDYAARTTLMGDIARATQSQDYEFSEGGHAELELPAYPEPELSDSERAHEESGTRSHPYTDLGRFSTSPTSILLPRNTFVEPVTGILSMASNRQLGEVARRAFGGDILPDSVATPSSKGRHLQQKPVALEASQARMGVMEANSYIAANMPGAYASAMATLVETRRRLGSEWIEGLLNKPGGPRVLDAGAAGAGVLAWHEVLRAEWTRMHPEQSSDNPVPLGKATVIAGSPDLRQRVSLLLENTTFLPRMQDFVPTRDLPGSPSHDPALRKQYDIIIAPHTLWTLKEDYMRKAQVQNYFTLLNPNGGVLILIEKGVPRGFELVAGAREVILEHHIISPGSEEADVEPQNSKPGRRYKKERGMIIAPCTNHGTCPMYTTPGQMVGRKDHCHFSQRFVRPPFLQRILGAKHHNHEDIGFSYLSVRRGIDERRSKVIPQDEESTLAALDGYEDNESEPNPFTLPRVLAPPIKKHKHVTFDLCTPAANLERWTIPKSFSKQGYRDARKARWGDLWALGAKTRVIRTSRSGTAKPKPTRVIEIGVGDTEDQDIIRDLTQGFVSRKDKGGKKRTKKSRQLTDDDLM